MKTNPGDLLGISNLEVTQDEAVELCLHHLALAATFFEATPDDNNTQIIEELNRRYHMSNDVIAGSRGFLTAIHSYHEKLKEEDF